MSTSTILSLRARTIRKPKFERPASSERKGLCRLFRSCYPRAALLDSKLIYAERSKNAGVSLPAISCQQRREASVWTGAEFANSLFC